MGRVKRASVCAVLLAAACGDIQAPVRYDCADQNAPADRCAYTFRHPDGWVFNWPADRQPVQVWVPFGGTTARFTQQGIDLWTSALLYNELSAMLVADSSDADIIVRRLADQVGDPSSPPCTGVSEGTFLLAGDTVIAGDTIGPLTLLEPIHTFVWGRIGESSPTILDCLEIVVAHELGHAFGILAHSTDTEDLMTTSPRRLRLTERDRTTIEMLYHTPPSIKPHRR